MGRLRERISTLTLLLPGDPETLTGGYIYARRIMEGLGRLGWRVEVHSLDSSFPQATPGALGHARSVLAGIPDGRIVVIDGLALGGMSSILGAETGRLRLVALVHHPLALETGLDAATASCLQQSERVSLTFMRGVIVTSRWTSGKLGEYGVPAERIRVVKPGTIRRKRPKTIDSPNDVVQRGAIREESLNLLCVATLTPRKGHAVLFDALAQLRDRRWLLYCAGSMNRDPATAAALGRQIDRLGLRTRIKLLGEIDEAALDRCYADADVFVLPTYMEGYGMALAEAVACGLPVVSTSAGAIPETVAAAASLLVPPGDSEALAEALATLMADPAAIRRLSINALAARKALPTWADAAGEFAAALDELIGIGS